MNPLKGGTETLAAILKLISFSDIVNTVYF